MRLRNRLFLSHLAPLLVVTCALGGTLAALLRITSALDDLERSGLVALRREGDLHRAAWILDVNMRHAKDDCRDTPDAQPSARISTNAQNVATTLEGTDPISPQMHRVIEGYLDVARELLADGVCAGLLSDRLETRRQRLDEELTNLWMVRLDELHMQVTTKKSEALRAAGTALALGVGVATGASVLAFIVAGWLARVVNRPLRALAEGAQRVGRGDFTTPVVIRGPAELMELAAELERMRLRLHELEALKQEFIASVSHELRTPLAKIREALSLLQDGVIGPLDDRQCEVVGIARTACEREIRLVTTLLDLSRLRAGGPSRPRDGLSIDAVVARAVEDEKSDADQRSVEVDLVLDGEAPTCRMDPVLVERAVANLVRNAIAVSAAGQTVEVRREIVPRSELGPKPWIRITVSDHGPGVPDEIRESMFQTFVTQPVPNSSKGIGFGLGLALSREVAKVHGGDLVLHASSPRGATLHLWLPFDPREGADADQASELQ